MILVLFNEHIDEQADHDGVCQGEDAGKYGGVFVEFYDTHVVRYNDVIGVVFGFREQI